MNFIKHKYKSIDYIRIPFRLSSLITTFIIVLRIAISITPMLQILATSFFVDKAISIFNSGSISEIYMPLLLLILSIALTWILSSIFEFCKLKLNLVLDNSLNYSIVQKVSKLKYKHIENSDDIDLISRVNDNCSEKILNGFLNVLDIAQYIIEISSILIIITFKVWWISLLFLIIIPLFLIVSFKAGELDYKAYSEAENKFRRSSYFKDILSSRDSYEERTLFQYSNEVNDMCFDSYEEARKIQYLADKKNYFRSKLTSCLTILLSITIAFVLLNGVNSGKISVGMYIALVTAFFKLIDKMSWELSYTLQQYANNKEYLKDLTSFSNLEEVEEEKNEKDYSNMNEEFNSIEFKNVTFSYPNTNIRILDNLSMKLESNKQYAFVGKNGSGKTTIVKLLTGLYDNYEGEILINGINIKDLNTENLRAYFSIVYQDFAKYSISLKENVLIGKDWKITKNPSKDSLILKTLKELNLENLVDDLKNGLNTKLGKIDEDGVDLSNGQWQRIAIARALLRYSKINILDEPTAALDPISESNIYSLFKNISKNKSTIFITHRLGAARIADEIIVIDNGKVIEQGSHEMLISKSGYYSEMFETQRSWYNE